MSKKNLLKILLLIVTLLPAGIGIILLSGCRREVNASTVSLDNRQPGISVVSYARAGDNIFASGHRVQYFMGSNCSVHFDFRGLYIEVRQPGQAPRRYDVRPSMIEEFNPRSENFRPFNSSVEGVQDFTIRWGQFTTDFQIRVVPIVATQVMVVAAPRVHFNLGDRVQRVQDQNGIRYDVVTGNDVFDVREGLDLMVKMNNEPAMRPVTIDKKFKHLSILNSNGNGCSFAYATSRSGINRRVAVEFKGARTTFPINVVNARRGAFRFDGVFINGEYGIDLATMSTSPYDAIRPFLHEGILSMLRTMLDAENQSGFIDALLRASELNETVQEALDILTLTYMISNNMALPNVSIDQEVKDMRYDFQMRAIDWAASQAEYLMETILDIVFRNDALDALINQVFGEDIINVISMVVNVLSSLNIEIQGRQLTIDTSAFDSLVGCDDCTHEYCETCSIFALIAGMGLMFMEDLVESTSRNPRADALSEFVFPLFAEIFGVAGDALPDGITVDIIPNFVNAFFSARQDRISIDIGIGELDINDTINTGDWYLPINLSLGLGFTHESEYVAPLHELPVTDIRIGEPGNVIVTRGGIQFVELVDCIGEARGFVSRNAPRASLTRRPGYLSYIRQDGQEIYDRMHTPVQNFGIRTADFGLTGQTSHRLFEVDEHNHTLHYVRRNGSRGNALNDQPLLRTLRQFLLDDYDRHTNRQNIFLRQIMTDQFLYAQGVTLADEILIGGTAEMLDDILPFEFLGPIGAGFLTPLIFEQTRVGIGIVAQNSVPITNATLLNRIFDNDGLTILGNNMAPMIYAGFVDQLIEQLFGMSHHANGAFEQYRRATYSNGRRRSHNGRPVWEFLGQNAWTNHELSTRPTSPRFVSFAGGYVDMNSPYADFDILLDATMLGVINTILDVLIAMRVRNNGYDFVHLINDLLGALLHQAEHLHGTRPDPNSPRGNHVVSIADMLRLGVRYDNGVQITLETLDISVDMPTARPYRDWRELYHHSGLFEGVLIRPQNHSNTALLERYQWNSGAFGQNRNVRYRFQLRYMHDNDDVVYLQRNADGTVTERRVYIWGTATGGRLDAPALNLQGTPINAGRPHWWDGQRMHEIQNPFDNIVYRLRIPQLTINIGFGHRGMR